jgi:glycine hydroxymethyltransferase
MMEKIKKANFEVHDPEILTKARSMLDACTSTKEMEELVLSAVGRNEEWRGKRCINLLAPEAPTSPTVRVLLSAEVGIRAAEGHIGSLNRWFAGTQYIDEIEALCMELLKEVFQARYADHRLMGSMIGNMAVYTALAQPGDVIMSVTQPFGGHSSNLFNGPAGVRGLKIVDVPFDPVELEVDLDLFRKVAPLVRPKVVSLGLSMTLFPFPIQDMREIIAEWGGYIYFDGAHQLGLVAAGHFQDALAEGAAVMTGSAGKTFSGPQSGIIVWNDPELTMPITNAIFPVLVATHQVNRVAALAVSAAEMLEFGKAYMGQIVRNAQALGAALHQRGIPILGAHKGYTRTQQVIADVGQFGGGIAVAQLLAQANIITNKNLIPTDGPEDWDHPSGLRMGTIEATRLGMREEQMETIADFMARILIEKETPSSVVEDVIEFRQPYQKLYYCFDNGLPDG